MASIPHEVIIKFEPIVFVCGKPVTKSYDALQKRFQFIFTGGDVDLSLQVLGFLPKFFFFLEEQVIVPVEGGASDEIFLEQFWAIDHRPSSE